VTPGHEVTSAVMRSLGVMSAGCTFNCG
jgi:hypothetical protein